MGQAAGLSGAGLEAFVASGGTLGSVAAGGGGIGLGAAVQGAVVGGSTGALPPGTSGAFDMGGLAGGVEGAGGATGFTTGTGGTFGFPSLASAGGLLQNLADMGGGIWQLYQAAQARGDVKEAQRILQEAFKQSDPFAPARSGAMQEYMTWQQDPNAYMSSPLARMQIDEMNRAVRAKQSQLGQTWNVGADGQIQGSGSGSVDFAKQLQNNLFTQYETALQNRAQQGGANLFPNMQALSQLGSLAGMENQARSQTGAGIGNIIGAGSKMFPEIGRGIEGAFRGLIGG